MIPVVNENDTVAVRELRFGDNDTLSALVATLVNADHLFLAVHTRLHPHPCPCACACPCPYPYLTLTPAPNRYP